MSDRRHHIDSFPWDEPEAAHAYAESIGGTVEPFPDAAYSKRGRHAIAHPNAEGLVVSRWNGHQLPSPATLTRRDSLLPGDMVFEGARHGVQTVTEVLYDGRPSGFLRYDCPYPDLFSGPADTLVPLLRRGEVGSSD